MNWFDGEGTLDFDCGGERREWPACANKDDLCPLCLRTEKTKCECNEDIDG